MPRLAAEPRLRRLLALVPWIVAHDGPSIAEVCHRFDCTRSAGQHVSATLSAMYP